MWSIIHTLALSLLVGVVTAWQPDFVLRVTEETIYSDCSPRHSVVVNGTSPGPLLRMMEGGHYWIRVYNDLPKDNTTIHWHGFTQFLTPFSDGVPQVSGWPIPAGHFYDYEFQLEEGFYGTYWYHSHYDFQLITAFGPIIVDQKNWTSPVEYDEDIVMMVGEYYHAEDQKIMAGILNDTKFAWMGDAQAVAINGNAGNKCNQSTLAVNQTCGKECGTFVQLVKPSTRYRVRLVGAGVISYFSLKLEGHKMTVFEADGTYLEPYEVDSLELALGQRYSILLETMAEPPKNDYYWRIQSRWRPTRVNGASIVRYDVNAATAGNPFCTDLVSKDPTPTDLATRIPLANESFGWVTSELKPWDKSKGPPSDDKVSRHIIFDGQQMLTGANKTGWRWSVNDVVDQLDGAPIPYLLQVYSRPQDQRMPNYTRARENGGYDESSNTYPAKMGEVIDLVLQNRAGEATGVAEAHPWHAHGAKFWDMGGGLGEFSYDAYNEMKKGMKGIPFRRDTTVAYPAPGQSYNESKIPIFSDAGWRLVRLEVTHPGVWLVHCHIIPHAVMGMQAILMFGAEELPDIPASLLQEYTTFGGGAFGTQTYDPGMQTRSYWEMVKARSVNLGDSGRRSVKWARSRFMGIEA